LKVTAHGSGYVELVSATCFADIDSEVLCVDRALVARLKRDEVPLVKPGLDRMLSAGLSKSY